MSRASDFKNKNNYTYTGEKNMKILVTGSSGMIGKETVRLLKERKIDVVEFSASEGLDVGKPGQLQKAIRGCHAVIHLAAIIDEKAPKEKIWKTNVEGTKNVLEAATKERIGRLVFLSSVGVYGNAAGIKNEETPLDAETAYEKSKEAGEKLVIESQELVPFTIIRSALVIGPNEYLKQIFKIVQKNVPLIGEGKNHWQTVYYKDLASAIVFLLFLDAAENETFVIAGNEKPTLKELVETIRSQFGMKNPAPTVSEWLGKLLAAIQGILLALQGKPNILSATHISRLLRERNYDLTKIHAYGWKSQYSYQKALKETQHELEQEKK